MHFYTRATMISRTARAMAGLLIGLFLVAALPALADRDTDVAPYSPTGSQQEPHYFGFMESPDHDREYAERLRVLPTDKDELPQSFSWTGQMTIAKSQGTCGSCWSFAAMGQIEAHMNIFYGQELDLSEQQGINCNPYGADCDGGWASAVYNVGMTYGMIREDAMGYASADQGVCEQGDFLPFAFITDWYYVTPNVTQIKTALLNGPVCSSMDANSQFDDYTTGCFSYPGGPYTNHLVVIVGWDDRACDDNGAWICKNSWGTDFGDFGLFTIQYGSSLIGTNVTQIELDIPDVDVGITGPDEGTTLFAGDAVDIEWVTTGASCSTVDIWFGADGVLDTQIADGIANDGSFAWIVPNFTTGNMRICVVADGDTRNGFDISDRYSMIGHKSVYVSALGSDTYPYATPADAANSIHDALAICAGRDTVLVAGGDYFGTIGVAGTTWVVGGWNDTFTVRDSQATPTRIQSATSGMVFLSSPDGHSGVIGFEFHDCTGAVGSTPALGKHGGGIYVSGSSPVIKDCIFTDNSADPYGGFGVGGAIVAYGGSPRIENCVFTGGLADQGGAVALFDPVDAVITGSDFVTNVCTETTNGQQGAAIYVQGGSLELVDNRFDGNGTTNKGGAVYAEGAIMVLTDNHFTGNQALVTGGAIMITGGSLTLTGGSLTGNSSITTRGGGLFVTGADAIVRNVLLIGNASPTIGSAIMLDTVGEVEIANCAFLENMSDEASMGTVAILTGESLLFRNNVLADNQGGGIGGGVTSLNLDFNVFWNNGVDYLVMPPGANDIQAEPIFVNAPAGDYGLALHSPCLDRGDPEVSCSDLDGSRNDVGLCGGPDAEFAAPAAVQGAVLTELSGGRLEITWTANGEPDMTDYVIYRGVADPFVPAAELVAVTIPHPGVSWIDEAPTGGYYLVVPLNGTGHVGGYSAKLETTTDADSGDTPRALAVTGVTPNPFNPRTKIAFAVPRAGHVDVRVHDMRGRVVKTLVSGDMAAGRHERVWEGRNDDGAPVATGVYLVRVYDGDRAATAKVVLTK